MMRLLLICFVDYRQGSIQERTGKKKVNQDVVPNEEGSQLGNRREKKMYFSAWGLCPGKRKMYPFCLGILHWGEKKRYLFCLEIFYWEQTCTHMSKRDLHQ